MPASVQSPYAFDESPTVLVVSKADVRSAALVLEEDERRRPLANVGDLAGGWSYVGRHCRLGVAVDLVEVMRQVNQRHRTPRLEFLSVVLGGGCRKVRRGAPRGASSFSGSPSNGHVSSKYNETQRETRT